MILLLTLGNSLLLGYFGFAYFVDLEIVTAALIGFAVSFSSTVCAVQILESAVNYVLAMVRWPWVF